MHSIIGALLIILIVSPHFWRDLRDARFLALLLPFLVLYFFIKLRKNALNVLSAVLLVSGIVFVSSNGISDYFPPPFALEQREHVYENANVFSNQYLRAESDTRQEPQFLDTFFL